MEDSSISERIYNGNSEVEKNIYFIKAGFIRRFIASVIDHLILFFILLFLINIFFDYLFNLFLLNDWLFALFVCISVLIINFYFIIFEWLWKGKTPGKWFTNIKVSDNKNIKPCLSLILIRNLLRSIYFIPPLFILPDIICFIFLKKRRIGDIAAGTDVIVDEIKF